MGKRTVDQTTMTISPFFYHEHNIIDKQHSHAHAKAVLEDVVHLDCRVGHNKMDFMLTILSSHFLALSKQKVAGGVASRSVQSHSNGDLMMVNY